MKRVEALFWVLLSLIYVSSSFWAGLPVPAGLSGSGSCRRSLLVALTPLSADVRRRNGGAGWQRHISSGVPRWAVRRRGVRGKLDFDKLFKSKSRCLKRDGGRSPEQVFPAFTGLNFREELVQPARRSRVSHGNEINYQPSSPDRLL